MAMRQRKRWRIASMFPLNLWRRREKQSAQHSIDATGSCDANRDMPADVPNQVLAPVEARHRLAVQYRARGGIDDVDPLRSAVAVPVQEVKSEPVFRRVRAIHVDIEARSRVPAGSNATARAGGFLQRAAVAGRRSPNVISLSAGAKCRVRGKCITIVDDIETLRSIAALPVAQC